MMGLSGINIISRSKATKICGTFHPQHSGPPFPTTSLVYLIMAGGGGAQTVRKGKGESQPAGWTRCKFTDESGTVHPQCELCEAMQVPLQIWSVFSARVLTIFRRCHI